jgi:hypothetical protein
LVYFCGNVCVCVCVCVDVFSLFFFHLNFLCTAFPLLRSSIPPSPPPYSSSVLILHVLVCTILCSETERAVEEGLMKGRPDPNLSLYLPRGMKKKI